MATNQQATEAADLARKDRQRTGVAIGKNVLEALGLPDDFLKVQVQPLWEDHYRVNVLVGAPLISTKVAHSYFLVADGSGNVIAATPKITRQY